MQVTTDTAPLDEQEAPRAVLGESLRWDGSAWWWVDAAAGTVWTRRPGQPADLVAASGQRTPVVHPTGDGRALVVVGTTIQLATPDPWSLRPLSEITLPAGWLLNDGVTDDHGRLWIGSVSPDRSPLSGQLLRVDLDGRSSVVASGFTLSNGMAWSADGRTLHHVDTFERRVWAHHVDPDDGVVTDSTPMIDFSVSDGLPDGMCRDADDGLWVAMYNGGQVRRHRPDGSLDHVIVVPTPQVTSCEIGGEDSQDMMITTAREGMDEAASAANPLAGRMFQTRIGHRGELRALAVSR